ncbi:MAG TPA: mannose-6-phosphate isomerase, class I [Polyangiaceae bacterium]|nr:mannose-6-phosphate isomerase, class I [Polyangiaceae bacterium]
MIEELHNTIQPYAWGSRRALAELRGDVGPSARPEAELWMGAHVVAPSRLASTGQSLLEAIETSPAALLGPAVAAGYGAKLPFLLKVLAAAEPLSLQAHPSLEQAARGFAADEAAQIPLTAPHRNYKDRNHKPELLCALSEFWALRGFREVAGTIELLSELGVAGLEPILAKLAALPNEAGIMAVFSGLMQAPPTEQRRLALATAEALRARIGKSARFNDELAWGVRIAELYPGDIGLVLSLLLNLVRLQPDEAIYLPAGNLHAYLGGTGVELMASSDNVLRGGLTPKHVNVPELLSILDFRPQASEVVRPRQQGAEHVYATEAREFRLSYFDLAGAPLTLAISGPEIWLVTAGDCKLVSPSSAPLQLTRGRSAFVSADAGSLTLQGEGRIFRARVGGSITHP